jgi:hypothetical protein
MTSVTIPASVTSIGKSACANCPSLTSVTLPASVASIGQVAITNTEYRTTGKRRQLAANGGSLKEVTLSRRTRVEKDAFPAGAQLRYSD